MGIISKFLVSGIPTRALGRKAVSQIKKIIKDPKELARTAQDVAVGATVAEGVRRAFKEDSKEVAKTGKQLKDAAIKAT